MSTIEKDWEKRKRGGGLGTILDKLHGRLMEVQLKYIDGSQAPAFLTLSAT